MIFCQNLSGVYVISINGLPEILFGSAEILRSGEFDFHFYQKIGIIFRRTLLTSGPAIRDIASYSLKLLSSKNESRSIVDEVPMA
jgi:hypothetical protein